MGIRSGRRRREGEEEANMDQPVRGEEEEEDFPWRRRRRSAGVKHGLTTDDGSRGRWGGQRMSWITLEAGREEMRGCTGMA